MIRIENLYDKYIGINKATTTKTHKCKHLFQYVSCLCLWRFLTQTHCLEWKSPPLKEWFLWEVLLISKSLSLQRRTWILIKKWRYFKTGRTLSFWVLSCVFMCACFHLLDFISSVLMLFKDKVFLQQIVTAITYSGFFFFWLNPIKAASQLELIILYHWQAVGSNVWLFFMR